MHENPYVSPTTESTVRTPVDIASLSVPQLALKMVLFATALIVGSFAVLWFILALVQTLCLSLGVEPGTYTLLVALKTYGFSMLATSATFSLIWLSRRIGRRVLE